MPFDTKSFWLLLSQLAFTLAIFAAVMHLLHVPLFIAMTGGVVIGLAWPTPKLK